MLSPKSNIKREPRKYKKRERHTHKNNKFYSGRSWRRLRVKLINDVTNNQYQDIQNLELPLLKQMYLLSMVPVCERCLKLYTHGAYNTVNKGTEVDHIDPINPDNALMSDGWGDPLDEDNLQLLCYEHHRRKTERDKKVIKTRQDERK